MNTAILRREVRLPLPRGDEMDAWVVDLTDPKLLRKTFVAHQAPYRYTPAGQIVRVSMPRWGHMKAEPLLRAMTNHIERMRVGDMLPRQFVLGEEYSDRDRAELVLATAFIEHGTPFCTYRIEPSGRTWFCYRMCLQVSWHPDKPKPESHPTIEPWRLAPGDA